MAHVLISYPFIKVDNKFSKQISSLWNIKMASSEFISPKVDHKLVTVLLLYVLITMKERIKDVSMKVYFLIKNNTKLLNLLTLKMTPTFHYTSIENSVHNWQQYYQIVHYKNNWFN